MGAVGTTTKALSDACLALLLAESAHALSLLDGHGGSVLASPRWDALVTRLSSGVPAAASAAAFTDILDISVREVLRSGTERSSRVLLPLASGGADAMRAFVLRCQLLEVEAERYVLARLEDAAVERPSDEPRAQALFDDPDGALAVGSWEWDLGSDEVVWSDSLYAMFGRERSDGPIDYATYLELLPEGDQAIARAAVGRALETLAPFRFEHCLRRRDGEERLIDSSGRVVCDAHRKPLRMVGTALDITDRRRLERTLRAQQRFLEAVVENIPDMVFVKDAAELRFVRFNRAGEELLGHARADLIGKCDHDFFPALEADAFTARDREVLDGREVVEIPVEPIHTAKHGVRLLRTKKVPLFDEQGSPQYLLGISEDVTERVRAEAFRLSDLLIRSIEDYAIFLLDPDGLVQTWNAGAQRVTGFLEGEIVGRPMDVLFPEVAVAAGTPARLREDAMQLGHVVDEGWRRRREGQPFFAIHTLTAVRDEGGAVVGFGAVLRDVTPLKQAEQQREQLLEDLKAAVRYRDAFLSIASHELRTPITTLKLQAELLEAAIQRKDGLAERIAPTLARVRRQVARLDVLVGSLLDVSLIASGRVAMKPVDVELGALVSQLVARITDDPRVTADISLSIPAPVEGSWDPGRVDQIVTNLLTNAVKYGRGRPIAVTVTRAGLLARIEVRDQGIGIEPADQERVFRQFERAVSEQHYGGLGIGLWIVRELAHAMRGAVTVHSVCGEGSTFVVELPCGGNAS